MSGAAATAVPIAVRTAACRAVLVSLAFAVAYAASNQLTHLRGGVGSGVFAWERAIPFLPWTIVPYLSIVFFFVLSFFVGRDRPALDRHVRRLLLVLALSVAGYAACPLQFTFSRPPTSGLTGLLFNVLGAVDLPYNRAPSLHIGVLLVLWVRFGSRLQGWRLGALHAWFTLIAVSVLTTFQHHVVDVPAGAAVACLCIVATRGRALQRKSRLRATRPSSSALWSIRRAATRCITAPSRCHWP